MVKTVLNKNNITFFLSPVVSDLTKDVQKELTYARK